MDLQNKINSDARKLVEKIREYSESQLENWKKIPYMVLDFNPSVLGNEVWEFSLLSINRGAFEEDYIDLGSGKLVSAIIPELEISSLSIYSLADKMVLKYALNLNKLNAKYYISRIEKSFRDGIPKDWVAKQKVKLDDGSWLNRKIISKQCGGEKCCL